ncbi:hypothetical protein M3O96_08695 [Aquiflexum sp. TKW24L]|uniref:lipocalin family protein n=1 Tax=Aquiflexum sp. TKW24L TaxID=2942212 RepID=UPI0020C0CA4B|nr:lipocalin family protein [Aquiflexum sp. TKW24L]MCL6259163.1 hypothetical protein [Aquiflexum sp. TKW24L]
MSIFLLAGCQDDAQDIEKWIIGTWNIDRYVQETYVDGIIAGESESVNQGEIVFKKDGTGEDLGGNFEGSEFEWENTKSNLFLTAGGSTTSYVIEEFSTNKFVFSITETNDRSKSVERWYFSK